MDITLATPSRVLLAAALLKRTLADDEIDLDPGDSAFYALTDFRHENPISVEPDCSIDDALYDMSRLSVHALLVIQQEQTGSGQCIVGLITSYRIERLRLHHRQRTGDSRCPDLRVGDVMTPWHELPLVNLESLRPWSALELYQMFQGTGLTHLLVVETDGDDSVLARGLISRANLAKRLRRCDGIDSRGHRSG